MPFDDVPGRSLGLFDLLPWVVGAAFLVFGVTSLVRTVPRLRRARPAQGVVLEARESGTMGESSGWSLLIAFRDVDGHEHQARWEGNSSLDQTRYVPGTAVPVRYDPRDPGWVWLPGGGRVHPLLLPVFFAVMGAVVVGLAVGGYVTPAGAR